MTPVASHPSSYQNAELSPSAGHYLNDDVSVDVDGMNRRRNRTLRSLASVGVLFLMAIASVSFATTSSSYNQTAMLRGSSGAEVSLSYSSKNDKAPWEGGENAPQADWSGEGRYDWQKCQKSNDPDCWANEGKRVGSYWQNFGLRMKAFWKSFGENIKNFFTFGGGSAEESSDSATTTKVEKTEPAAETPAEEPETVTETSSPPADPVAVVEEPVADTTTD